MTTQEKSVFEYIDYRQYLRDYYEWHKENERRFSFRVMARRLGFSSPNFLKLVMDGDRNVGKESLDKISKGLKMRKREVEYFSYLVFFSQARSTIDKNYYFGLITSLRSRVNVAAVTPEMFEYIEEWYIPAVREMIVGKREPVDYAQMASAIQPAVSAKKIKKAVETLLRLGFIQVQENGCYGLSTKLLNTENELNSFAVRNYHKGVLDVARQAIDAVAAPEREVSSLTVRVSGRGFEKLKKRLQEFRQELLQMVGDDTDTDSVYHVNLQLYPLVRKIEDENN